MSENGLYHVGKAQLIIIVLCKVVASRNCIFQAFRNLAYFRAAKVNLNAGF